MTLIQLELKQYSHSITIIKKFLKDIYNKDIIAISVLTPSFLKMSLILSVRLIMMK